MHAKYCLGCGVSVVCVVFVILKLYLFFLVVTVLLDYLLLYVVILPPNCCIFLFFPFYLCNFFTFVSLINKKILKKKKKNQLTKLLEIATTNQLFPFNGQLYEQIDGVAMGSPLGPLMANVFLCHLEDNLTRDGAMPTFYKRYVDDTLARMPSTDAAVDFLTTLNSLHPSLSFTMELPVDNKISFIGIEIIKNRTKIDAQVFRKPTNTDLNRRKILAKAFFSQLLKLRSNCEDLSSI